MVVTMAAGSQEFPSHSSAVSITEQNRRLELFRPAFEQLVGLIRGRVRYPEDYHTWHADERADFKRLRVAVGETLLDAARELPFPPNYSSPLLYEL